MRSSGLLAVALSIAGCATVATHPEAREPGKAVPLEAPLPSQLLFVDEQSAAANPDGSAARPFRRLTEALGAARPPATVRLAPGLYEGGVTIPPGVTVEGDRTAVIHGEAGQITVQLPAGASLRGITVQGGDVGVSVDGRDRDPGDARERASPDSHLASTPADPSSARDVRGPSASTEPGDATGAHTPSATAPLPVPAVSSVAFSGQRRAAIDVGGGELRLEAPDIEGTVSETRGVILASGGRVDVVGGLFHGALRAGIEGAAGSMITVRDVTFDGAVSAIKAENATVTARGLRISGGRAAAIWVTGGRCTLFDVAVFGHEYGLLASGGVMLDVRDFTSVRPERTAAGLFEARGSLEGVVALDSGDYGGVQISSSEVTLRRFVIARSKDDGIIVVGGKLILADGAVLDVLDASGKDGDAVAIRRAAARVSSLTVARTAGSGIVGADGAQLAVADAQLEDTRYGGLTAETGARVEAISIEVRRSKATALVVPEAATLKADVVDARDDREGLLWAECGQGAEVMLGRVRGPELKAGTRGTCVGAWANPRLFDPFAASPLNPPQP